MSEYIDISMPVHKNMPHWPGMPTPKIRLIKEFDKDGVKNSVMSTDLHAGTHIDAPSHYFKDGISIDELPLHKFLGSTYVLKTDAQVIDSSVIQNNKEVFKKYKRILFKTSNSKLLNKDFRKDYTAFDNSGAMELCKHDIELVGIDYLSIQKFGNKYSDVHKALLLNNILILEGLDLSRVNEGIYKLYAFPIHIIGVEASPVRAVLKSI